MSLNLLDLHLELIYIILEYVHNSSPYTSRSVSRVNKCLHDATQVVCNRRRTLNLGNKFNLTSLDAEETDWVRNTNTLSSIRHLTINGQPRRNINDSKSDDVYMQLICDLIERIGNLKSLTWNIGPISRQIVETLGRKHPKAQLRTFNYWRKDYSISHLTEDELAVSTFKRLTDFRAVVLDHGPEHPAYRDDNYCLDAYKHMIANSKSLQYAGIADCPDGVFVSERGPRPPRSLQAVEHNRCESLRSLTLDTASLELSKDSLDELNRFVDVAQLETLKFVRGQPKLGYFQNAAAMLPNIKHVSLNFASMSSRFSSNRKTELPQAANKYLLTCSPLTSLSIWNASEFVDIDELIIHHRKTIEVLQIHHNDSYGVRPELSVQTIASMREKCTKLRDLTLDLNRKDYTVLHPPFEQVNLTLSENQSALDRLKEIALFGGRLSKVQFYVENINADLLASLLVTPDGYIRYPTTHHYSDDHNDSDDSDRDDANHDHDDEDGEPGNSDGDRNDVEDLVDLQGNEEVEVKDDYASAENVRYQPLPWDDWMKQYVEDIWKRVFGGQEFGDRAVDVKFGEWESKFVDHRYENRRWFEVRPHERDDRPGDCFIKVSKPSF